MKQIASVRENAITYLNQNHNKIWSRSKFGISCKCDYITNNISEAFNSWIGEFRYQPILDLLDSIREKLMKRFDRKRRIVMKWNDTLFPKAKKYLNNISKNLGEYEVSRTSDTQAEVTYKTKRWDVNLLERKCSCRVWQVKGLPCVHAAAFIAFTRDTDWDKYVDPYFTIEKFKEAYALEIGTISGKDQWVHIDTGEKIHPPITKRPPGRPRKNRIISLDEPKRRRHKCSRCGQFGHREKTCNNLPSQGSDQYETSQASSNKRRREKTTKAHESGAVSGLI
uniref:uncharacterized protein LOC122599378 n=1 Tax=Erigeron canadensis TaxID=72917 RepID=UPI001CB95DB5|nr:uncharacterized protein LOC122599378 [Erigeron canadensis]